LKNLEPVHDAPDGQWGFLGAASGGDDGLKFFYLSDTKFWLPKSVAKEKRRGICGAFR